jgi:hypothetical protein
VPEWAVFDDAALAKGYTVVPNVLFDMAGLPPAARFLYIVLLRHGKTENAAYPSHTILMRELGAAENSVRAWLMQLEGVGLIAREKRVGRLDVIRFLPLSTAVAVVSKSDTPAESEPPQNLPDTPSDSEGVPRPGPSDFEGGILIEENGRRKDRTPVGVGRKRRVSETALTCDQAALMQECVDLYWERLKQHTGVPRPRWLSKGSSRRAGGAVAAFFREQIVDPEMQFTREDLLGIIGLFFDSWVHPEGAANFDYFMRSWNALLKRWARRQGDAHGGADRGEPRTTAPAAAVAIARPPLAGGVQRGLRAVSASVARGVEESHRRGEEAKRRRGEEDAEAGDGRQGDRGDGGGVGGDGD